MGVDSWSNLSVCIVHRSKCSLFSLYKYNYYGLWSISNKRMGRGQGMHGVGWLPAAPPQGSQLQDSRMIDPVSRPLVWIGNVSVGHCAPARAVRFHSLHHTSPLRPSICMQIRGGWQQTGRRPEQSKPIRRDPSSCRRSDNNPMSLHRNVGFFFAKSWLNIFYCHHALRLLGTLFICGYWVKPTTTHMFRPDSVGVLWSGYQCTYILETV
jgi:hypothetical protein